MPIIEIKVVRDEAPDEDGRWATAEVPSGVKVFEWRPAEGLHVVASRRAADLQDGGPMHAAFLAQPKPEFVWRVGQGGA